MTPNQASRLYSNVWRIVSPWKSRLVFGFLGLLWVSCASLVYPSLLRVLVDHSIGQHASIHYLVLLASGLLLFFASASIVGYYQQSLFVRLGFELRNTLRAQLAGSLLEKPLRFHQAEKVGELMTRLTEDIARIQTLFSSILGPLFQNALVVLGCLVFMALINAWATVLVIVLMILFIPATLFGSGKVREYSARGQSILSEANATIQEALIGIREIKAFVREADKRQQYIDETQKALQFEMKGSKIQISLNQVSHFVVSLLFVSIFILGTKNTLFPSWTLGGIVAFYFYAYTMTISFIAIGRTYLSVQSVVGPLTRVVELLSGQESYDPGNAKHRGAITGEISFSHVSFSYEQDHPVLTDTSFTFHTGDWILIQGPSGSGKSTLGSLITGMLVPLEGTIAFDTMPVQQWDMHSLRRQIGYVGQEPHIFRGTLRDNLLFAQQPKSAEEITKVLEVTCLAHYVRTLPHGLDTQLEEHGRNLSGGQRARVAIARALLIDPAVLILDEVTHSVERELEMELFRRLQDFRASKTTIIFTHHPEQAHVRCRHFILDGGVLVEQERVLTLVNS